LDSILVYFESNYANKTYKSIIKSQRVRYLRPTTYYTIYGSGSQPFYIRVPPHSLKIITYHLTIFLLTNNVYVYVFYKWRFSWRTTSGTRTIGWEALVYGIIHFIYNVHQHLHHTSTWCGTCIIPPKKKMYLKSFFLLKLCITISIGN